MGDKQFPVDRLTRTKMRIFGALFLCSCKSHHNGVSMDIPTHTEQLLREAHVTGKQFRARRRSVFKINCSSPLPLGSGVWGGGVKDTRLESKVFSLERLYPSSTVEVSKSKTNIGSKKNMGPQKFWVCKNLKPKKFRFQIKVWLKKSLGHKIFLDPQKLLVKKMLTPKNFWSKSGQYS